jgi:signal transduction histidine kinase
MSPFRSVIFRISLLHIVAVVVTCLAMPAALYYMLDRAVADLHDRALRDYARDIAGLLEKDADGTWHLSLPLRLHEMYSESYGRYAYSVLDRKGDVLFTSLEQGRALMASRSDTSEPYYFTGNRDFEQRGNAAFISGASIPFQVAGELVWVQVGEDMTHRDVLIDDVVNDFFSRVGWITAPILLLLLAIEIVIIRRGLQPVVRASDLATRIGPATVDLRLPEAGMPREILPLVHAINEALDRLEHGFRAQREFTADAAHELRTPLAILHAHVDMIEDDEVAEALRQDIATMSRLVGQLLEIAELETLVISPDELADLSAVCSRTSAYIAPLAAKQGKSVKVIAGAEPVLIRGNADALGQAVRNLVENALVHTAPGTTVEVRLTDAPAIHVCDHGPGVPKAERAIVFRRFWRRDRRRSGSSGLGLSIVSRIVEAHGGSVAVDDNRGGGAIFSIRFPASVRVELEHPEGEPERRPAPEPVQG